MLLPRPSYHLTWVAVWLIFAFVVMCRAQFNSDGRSASNPFSTTDIQGPFGLPQPGFGTQLTDHTNQGQNTFGFSPNNIPFGSNADVNRQGGAINPGTFSEGWNANANTAALCPPVWSDDAADYSKINWNNVDRRCEEGWWHLYPFGERYFDTDWGLGNSRLWHDKQIDLDFFLPYYGFRFNYTFIYPEGFLAFSYPRYIQPPYKFPVPKWPRNPDPSLIAAFLAPQSFMFVGDTGISHVWYRIVSRPISQIRNKKAKKGDPSKLVYRGLDGNPAFRTWGSEILKIEDGRVEDPALLDLIHRDLSDGMVGMRGFIPDYALIVTWERMGYGGAPKSTALHRFNDVRRWQNTYQMVIATDEIRTVAMFNYANINWTSSTAAGALFGRGGLQSAVVGFNGGNGTGFYKLPWSAEGNSYKLVQYGSTKSAGRWLARIDDSIVYGGCTNNSKGVLRVMHAYISMIGGVGLNVSGPCLKKNYVIKMQIDEITVDCIYIDMIKARCIIPINSLWRIGPTEIKISIDGGRQYNFWRIAYLLAPGRSRGKAKLIDDPLVTNNNWRSIDPHNLTLKWSRQNITTQQNAKIDITLWGYWENLRDHDLVQVGSIARGIQNAGRYTFDPRLIVKTDMLPDSWKKFRFGMVQVRVSHDWMSDLGNGLYWSKLVPFGWYFRDVWEQEYGSDFAKKMCIDWYEEDGRKYQFWQDVEKTYSCPCTLDQAVIDHGHFQPVMDCDMFGDGACTYVTGAAHCVISAFGLLNGAAQHCCYDPDGWLMFSQDYEYDIGDNYAKFYGAGSPFRAHPYGAFPYKKPPYVPSYSHYFNDILPQDICCSWAGHCEFYYWRRESSGCQDYHAPTTGFGYGDAHFITFDGTKYSFNGNGYFVLATMDSPSHALMVQVRMEEPPKTIWNANVKASVITGLAAKDNNSASIEVYARKEFRRWRYKMDIFIWGLRVRFDRPHKKLQHGGGVSLFNPARALNTSIIWIYFQTGVAIRVAEDYGVLNVILVLPHNYNITADERQFPVAPGGGKVSIISQLRTPLSSDFYERSASVCGNSYHTMGLLGAFSGNPYDDLVGPDCETFRISQPPTPAETRQLYYDFGMKWKVDGERFNLIFNPKRKPLYNPSRFGKKQYSPIFNPWSKPLGNASLIISKNQVRSSCQGMWTCEYDYLMTGRKEIALSTRKNEILFDSIKGIDGTSIQSCGPLQKNRGIIKIPAGNNYLDGVTVHFACQPEYFLHGDRQRSCINGTWTPGWWAWCRSRKLEEGLKWFTGLVVSFLILAVIAGILGWCYSVNVRGRRHRAKHYQARHTRTTRLVSSKQGIKESPKRKGNDATNAQISIDPLAANHMPNDNASKEVHGKSVWLTETAA